MRRGSNINVPVTIFTPSPLPRSFGFAVPPFVELPLSSKYRPKQLRKEQQRGNGAKAVGHKTKIYRQKPKKDGRQFSR